MFSNFLRLVAIVFIAYILGSINFAVIFSRLFFKDDVREHSSGNAGATNMARSYGFGFGVLTLAGDFFKAIAAVYIGKWLLGGWGGFTALAACLTGHAYPVFFRFKGGKGVAVCFGAAFALDWRVFVIMLLIFLTIVISTGLVSVSSIISITFMIPAVILLNGLNIPLICAGILSAAVVVFLHRANIKRLIDGTESRFTHESFKKICSK